MRLHRHFVSFVFLCLWATVPARAEIAVPITHLIVEQPAPPVLSNLDPIPEDLGEAGAQVGLKDNATTGRFLGHNYTLDVVRVPEGYDSLAAAQAALANSPFLLIDAPTEVVTAIADLPEAADKLLFNVGSEDPALRSDACRVNVLHTAPSVSMRTDALVQFFVKKRWSDIVMIRGQNPKDLAYAAAMERSLAKFRLDLAASKDWVFDADMRRNAAQEVPLFTQEFGDYDVLVVADEIHDFGRYILYNTSASTTTTATTT